MKQRYLILMTIILAVVLSPIFAMTPHICRCEENGCSGGDVVSENSGSCSCDQQTNESSENKSTDNNDCNCITCQTIVLVAATLEREHQFSDSIVDLYSYIPDSCHTSEWISSILRPPIG